MASGLGKELPSSSALGEQPLLAVILNEPCPALNTAHYLAIIGQILLNSNTQHSSWCEWEPSSAPRSLLKLFKHSPLPSLLLLPLPTSPHSKPNNFPFLCYIKIICRKSNTLSSGLSSISRVYSHVAAVLISGAHLFSAGTKCSQLFPVQGRWAAYQSRAFRGCGTV